MFSFNPYKYDFWPVYDSIRNTYPIGIDFESFLFKNYPGQIELEKRLVDNIHNEDNFKNRWVDFEGEVSKKLKTPVTGTTYGQEPSFSSYLTLSETKTDFTVVSVELHFFVSVIGPFYSVLGIINSTTPIEDKKIHSTQFLVVSPYGQFSAHFKETCFLIEARFKNYRLIPFFLCQQKLTGLPNRFSSKKSNTVFSAIFSSQIPIEATFVGDEHFKIEQWAKSDPTDGGSWTSYPPIVK